MKSFCCGEFCEKWVTFMELVSGRIKLVKMNFYEISCFKWLFGLVDVKVSWIKLFWVRNDVNWLNISGLSIWDEFDVNCIENGFENRVLRVKTEKIQDHCPVSVAQMCAPGARTVCVTWHWIARSCVQCTRPCDVYYVEKFQFRNFLRFLMSLKCLNLIIWSIIWCIWMIKPNLDWK